MSTKPIEKPPPVLGIYRMLAHAVLDESVRYTGQPLMFLGTEKFGAVPCLAIVQDFTDRTVYLLHCDRQWDALFLQKSASVEDAKAAAERRYVGVSAMWIESTIVEAEALAFRDAQWAGHRCSFCGRDPLEGIERMVYSQKADARICDSCIKTCQEFLIESKS